MDNIKTKDRILMVALDLFSEKGYDGVGVDLIAEKVGIKGPSIYAHFKGKEDILNSLIKMMEDRYDEHIGGNKKILKIPTTLEEFKMQCLDKIDFSMHDAGIKKIRRMCAMEQFRKSGIAELLSNHQMYGLVDMFSSIIAKMIEGGLIKQGDADMFAFELVSPMALLMGIYDRQPNKEKEISILLDKHINHFIETYKA